MHRVLPAIDSYNHLTCLRQNSYILLKKYFTRHNLTSLTKPEYHAIVSLFSLAVTFVTYIMRYSPADLCLPKIIHGRQFSGGFRSLQLTLLRNARVYHFMNSMKGTSSQHHQRAGKKGHAHQPPLNDS